MEEIDEILDSLEYHLQDMNYKQRERLLKLYDIIKDDLINQ